MRAINITVSGENVEADDIHECCLIYVSPMPVLNDSVDQDGIKTDEYDGEAVRFNTKHHMNFIWECF